jgi:hypothetical protein
MARQRGPRGYVPAVRGVSPTQRRAAEQGREYRSRETVQQFRERLEAAKAERARSILAGEHGQRARELGLTPSSRGLRRYERSIAQKYGMTPEVSRDLNRRRYWEVVRDFRDANHPGMSLQKVRQLSGFREVLIGLESTDTSPDGPLARALVALGRRDPFARYQVGETPR